MKCVICGDGVYKAQDKCTYCKPDPLDKQVELLKRDLYDALKLLKKIKDMTFTGYRHSPQELASEFMERFE